MKNDVRGKASFFECLGETLPKQSEDWPENKDGTDSSRRCSVFPLAYFKVSQQLTITYTSFFLLSADVQYTI